MKLQINTSILVTANIAQIIIASACASTWLPAKPSHAPPPCFQYVGSCESGAVWLPHCEPLNGAQADTAAPHSSIESATKQRA